jgi:hypothetical protein
MYKKRLYYRVFIYSKGRIFYIFLRRLPSAALLYAVLLE